MEFSFQNNDYSVDLPENVEFDEKTTRLVVLPNQDVVMVYLRGGQLYARKAHYDWNEQIVAEQAIPATLIE